MKSDWLKLGSASLNGRRLVGLLLLMLGSSVGFMTTMAQTNWLNALPAVPALRIPPNLADWRVARAEIRSRLNQLLGSFPEKPPRPSVATTSRSREANYWREQFVFDDGIGGVVPGYLLLPLSPGPHPAILYCHWHGGEYSIGKEELFQTNHTPVAPGVALVEQGYVVIAVDAPAFGERQGKGPDGEIGSSGEVSAAKWCLWAGRTMWGWILRDDRMALDYLLTRPEVDPNKVGVMGISMGATRTWWLMALDDRLKAGVAIACLTRYQDLIAAGGLKGHGIYYFVPGMLNHFDSEAVVACIAPRPILFLTGDQDRGSPISGVKTIESAARPAWELFGQSTNFVSRIYPGLGHVYTPEMWARTLDWWHRYIPIAKP